MPLIEMTSGGSRFLYAVLYQWGKTPAPISDGIKNCSLPVSVAGHNPPLR